MKVMGKIVSCVLFIIIIQGCFHKKEVNYDEVGNAVNALLNEPAQFCNYVNSTPHVFSDRFNQCANSKYDEIGLRIIEIQDYCDEIFTDGYNRIKCDEDYGVPSLQTNLNFLASLVNISRGVEDCSSVSAVIQLTQNYWDTTSQELAQYGLGNDMPSWQEYVAEYNDERIVAYRCIYKESRF